MSCEELSRTIAYSYDALGNRIAKTTAGSSIFYTRGFELISRIYATRELGT